jgi:hypothetical protein
LLLALAAADSIKLLAHVHTATQALNLAAEVLTSDSLREEYDSQGTAALPGSRYRSLLDFLKQGTSRGSYLHHTCVFHVVANGGCHPCMHRCNSSRLHGCRLRARPEGGEGGLYGIDCHVQRHTPAAMAACLHMLCMAPCLCFTTAAQPAPQSLSQHTACHVPGWQWAPCAQGPASSTCRVKSVVPAMLGQLLAAANRVP